jgi:putative membrane protein
MGPKIGQLPVLLALAYLGIGYVAWTLALLILGCNGKPIRGARVLALPVLASFIMLAWDLAMDPVWSNLDRAWVWEDGGAYFGVPAGNFLGWLLTAYCYYQAFALYSRANPIRIAPRPPSFWLPPIGIYLVCALGNVLVLKQPMSPPLVTDAAGRVWRTADILRACALASLLVMVPFAALAWFKARQARTSVSTRSAAA